MFLIIFQEVSMLIWLVLSIAILPAASYLIVAFLHASALRHHRLDFPNKRSSHSRPTPTGGGIAFVAVFVLGCALWYFRTHKVGEGDLSAILIGGGCLLSIVGWVDDLRGLSIRSRLSVQLFVVFLSMAKLCSLDSIDIDQKTIAPSIHEKIFFTLVILWLTNAYNFMDGIDGLAAGMAVVVGLAGAALFSGSAVAVPLFLIALAVAGFLVWNWPPAKIFMGDAGSGFLGFAFAVSWTYTSGVRQGLFVWPILLAVFLVDATLTLLVRVYRGEKFYESHCSHAYQLASKHWSHKKVTSIAILVTIFWLVPCAALCQIRPSLAPFVAVVAYAPLILTYFLCRKRFG